MTRRIQLLLLGLGLCGALLTCAQLLSSAAGHRAAADVLGVLATMAYVAFFTGMVVQRECAKAAAGAGPLPAQAVAKNWMPEVVDVFISTDLAREFGRRREEILSQCSAIRARHGFALPIVRIRDDSLLRTASYQISINGLRVFAQTLDPGDDVKAKLIAALEETFDRYADAIRFFAELRTQAA